MKDTDDTATALRAMKDNVPASLAELAADELDHLWELVHEDPASWSFDTLLFVGRRMLKEVYPPDIFTGSSGDSGPQYVVAIREAIKRIDDQR